MRTESEIGRVERRSVAGTRWSPAQFIAGLIGLFLTVVSGVALARLLPTDSITGETTEVMAMGFTVLMAALTLLLGLIFLATAGNAWQARSGMISLGVLLMAFGLITFIEPEALGEALGVTETSGVVYAAIGLVSVIAGITSPTLVAHREVERRVVDEDEVTHVT